MHTFSQSFYQCFKCFPSGIVVVKPAADFGIFMQYRYRPAYVGDGIEDYMILSDAYAEFLSGKVVDETLIYIADRWKSHATLTLLAKQDCPLWLQYD